MSRRLMVLLLFLATPLHAGLTQIDRLASPNPAPGDKFGGTVATAQGLVAVAAYEARGKAGAVYLFHREGTAWVAFQVPDQAAPGDQLGFSLALSADGGTLVAGAPFAGGCGAVYRAPVDPVAGRTTGPLQRVAGAACERGAEIGSAVAIQGALIVAGARGADRRAGRIYVSEGGGPLARLPAAGAAGDELGQSVATDGRRVIAGAPFGSSPGAPATGKVLVFTRDEAGWEAALLPASPSAGDAFGYAVAMQGERIAVGAPLAHGQAGEVDLYEGGGEVVRVAGTAARAQLGVSVAFAGNQAYAGARWFNGRRGAVFPLPAGAPLQADPAVSNAELGFDLAYADGLLVAGAFQEGGRGAAYVFAERDAPRSGPEIVLRPVQPVRESMDAVPLVVSTRNGQPVSSPVSVHLKTTSLTAVEGSDYQGVADQLVQIPAGASRAETRVALLQDGECEGEERFLASLFDPQGATLAEPSRQEVRLRDETSGLALSPDPLDVDEGGSALLTVTLLCTPSSPVTVQVEGPPGVLLVPSTLQFAPGQQDQERQVTVRSLDDSSCDPVPPAQLTARVTAGDPRYRGLSGSVGLLVHAREQSCVSGLLRLCVQGDGTVLYAAVLRNDSSAALPDDPASFELFDPLPPEVAVVSATADHGVATVDYAGNTVAWNGSLPSYGEDQETVTVWIVGALTNGDTPVLVRNQASLLDGALTDDPRLPDPGEQPTDFLAGSTPCDPAFPD